MKRKLLALGIAFHLMWQIPYAQTQMDTILTMSTSDYDTAGFAKYPSSYVNPGQVIAIYKAVSQDVDNDLVMVKSFIDDDLGLQHFRYQQTYKGLRVEFAEFVEHAENGYVTRANGKIVGDLDASITPTATESEALGAALSPYGENTFAWEDEDMEEELQKALDDVYATYYPTGELLFALDNYSYLPAVIPAARYRLAWRFDVLSIDPYFHKAIYVDASDGSVFREEPLTSHNGPASVFANTPLQTWATTQTIDTKWDPGSLKYVLSSNDNGRNIHTKKETGAPTWNGTPEVKDGDDDWPIGQIMETSVHWNACEAWDFFDASPYNRDGMDDNGSVVRVMTQWNLYGTDNAFFDKYGGFQRIFVGVDYCQGALDVIGHEFTHGVTLSTAELPNTWEGGALNESMSDIFGTLIERRTNSSATDWLLGNLPTFVGGNARSMDDPSNFSVHFDPSSCTLDPGQPTCWLGPRWEWGACDGVEFGAHINCSVQNHAFFLLANGGSGTNEMSNPFNVTGIGITDAARIAYRALTTIYHAGTQYPQARSSWIQAAEEIFGVCSQQARQTANAWAAVNVGAASSCPVGAEDPTKGENASISVSPNPSGGEFVLTFSDFKAKEIVVTNSVGQVIKKIQATASSSTQLDLLEQPVGIYFVHVTDPARQYSIKLIKR